MNTAKCEKSLDERRKHEQECKARAARNLALIIKHGGDAEFLVGDYIHIRKQPTGISGEYVRITTDAESRLAVGTTSSIYPIDKIQQYLKELRVAVRIAKQGQR